MSFGTSWRGPIAGIIFTATAIAGVCDNAASSPLTNIAVGLNTADPTSGNQTTSESAYTSYARVNVARTTGGWANASGVVTNVAAISFPACTGGSSTVTHVHTGTAASGTGIVIVPGALTGSLAVTSGITPQFAISALSITVA